MAEAPIYVPNVPADIIAELVEEYSSLTGRVVYPAQVERLIMNAFAYRESLVRQAIQDAATQNLVAFSRAPILDYLAELVGVKRIGALPAECTIRFTLPSNPSGVTIPAGTRIASIDGRAVFATADDLNIPATVLVADMLAISEAEGMMGNGYTANQIRNILDPLPFVATASNLQTTAGGAEIESDENLRERIRLAPSSFSNAGSKGAYTFWAKTANPDIIDVSVLNPVPGTVEIFPLMKDGSTTPSQVLTAVAAAANDEKVRPLTDTVIVTAPTRIDYGLEIRLTLYNDANQSEVETQVLANLELFTRNKRLRMGQDIVLNQVEKECLVDGVYDVQVLDANSDPFATIVVGEAEFAFCSTIDIQTIGQTAG
jgi:phage-related baseplate assembly protein